MQVYGMEILLHYGMDKLIKIIKKNYSILVLVSFHINQIENVFRICHRVGFTIVAFYITIHICGVQSSIEFYSIQDY
jgi:hypothetical protein